jgi:hypothetical protein
MSKFTQMFQKSGVLAILVVFCALLGVEGLSVMYAQTAQADMLTSRSLRLSSSANGSVAVGSAGTGGNGTKAKHTATFTMATSGATVGSVALIYCTSPIPQTSCTSSAAATGDESHLTSASISGTGLGGSGWALDTTTSNPTITGYGTCNGATGTTRDNCVLLKASSAGANTGTPTITVQYGGGASDYVTNPTNDNNTFYVRIIVFSGTDYSTVVDNGGVANSTAQQIDITAKVQEKLNFSVGKTYVAPGATCTAFSDDGALALGDSSGVLDSAVAYDALSYFRVSTNALNGAAVQYSGDTLKSGANDVNALASESLSSPGSEQFGLGLNTANADYSFSSLSPAGGYDEANGNINPVVAAKFNYDTNSVTTPVTLASVGAGTTVTCDTGVVRYIGNISTITPPGIYTTSVTYFALPTF